MPLLVLNLKSAKAISLGFLCSLSKSDTYCPQSFNSMFDIVVMIFLENIVKRIKSVQKLSNCPSLYPAITS